MVDGVNPDVCGPHELRESNGVEAMNSRPRRCVQFFLLLSVALFARNSLSQVAPQPTTAAEAASRDTSYIDEDGTSHVTRVVPVPADLSPEAQKSVGRQVPDEAPPEPLADRRSRLDALGVKQRAAWSKLCPNTVVETTMGGVPVHVVTPDGMPQENNDKVLMNLHGGSFNADSGSYAESIPIAGYTKMKVVAVLYRLAPEHPFPAAVDDGVAVYKELLKSYKPNHIVIYGTSAGAALTAEIAVRLKQLSLPMPAALGIFSTLDSFAHMGDSYSIFTLSGFKGHLSPPDGSIHDAYYVGSTDTKDPVLSPVFADLHGLPPTLFISSERDALLSGTANLDRAYLRAGVDARLILFDALPHAFWYDSELPESIEANHYMADFMVKELAK
jgi:monoterpene epsilon-lactone hydrolase